MKICLLFNDFCQKREVQYFFVIFSHIKIVQLYNKYVYFDIKPFLKLNFYLFLQMNKRRCMVQFDKKTQQKQGDAVFQN